MLLLWSLPSGEGDNYSLEVAHLSFTDQRRFSERSDSALRLRTMANDECQSPKSHLSGGGIGNAIPARHESSTQRDAAAGRQTADPVRCRGGDSLRNSRHHHCHWPW